MSKPQVLVEVRTFLNATPDEIDTTRVIDHADPLHRAWLAKHSFWALRNDRGIELQVVEAQ